MQRLQIIFGGILYAHEDIFLDVIYNVYFSLLYLKSDKTVLESIKGIPNDYYKRLPFRDNVKTAFCLNYKKHIFATNVFETLGMEFKYAEIAKDVDLTRWSYKNMLKLQDIPNGQIEDKMLFEKTMHSELARILCEQFPFYSVIIEYDDVLREICKLDAVNLQMLIGVAGYWSKALNIIAHKKYGIDSTIALREVRWSVDRLNEDVTLLGQAVLYMVVKSEAELQKSFLKKIKVTVPDAMYPEKHVGKMTDEELLFTKRKDGRIKARKTDRDEKSYLYAILQERIIQYSNEMCGRKRE